MGVTRSERKALISQLERAGFVAAREEFRELLEAAERDGDVLHCWVARRLAGEPLAWLRGFVMFAGNKVRVDRGVYVPRPQTEPLARRAAELLPERGLAADLGTGSGAIAVALQQARPAARVLATDIDPSACRCAAKNGVEVYQGHLAEPLPKQLCGRFDLVVAVLPYVPTDELIFLPRDVRQYEPLIALDGKEKGMGVVEPAVLSSAVLLRSGGSLILEVGGDQDEQLLPVLDGAGFVTSQRFVDDEGDLRGIEAKRQ